MNECSVTYFKNHALRILTSIAETGDEMIVTKRGKPFAHIEPVKSTRKLQFGKLKDTMRLNEDIVAPVCDANEWTACQ